MQDSIGTAQHHGDSAFSIGLTFSLILHSVLLYILMFGMGGVFKLQTPPTIYSVTLEGGKALGGIDQASLNDKKKTEVAPPKMAQSAMAEKLEQLKEKEAEVAIPKKLEKKEEKKEEKKAPEKPKPTPPPKPQATPKPQAKGQTLSDIDKKLAQAAQRYTGDSSKAGKDKRFGAAALGGNAMGGGTVISPEERRYILMLRDHFRRGWIWHDKSLSLAAVVRIKVEPNGKISGFDIIESSGNREFDESVTRAVVKGDPAPPPPPQYYNKLKLLDVEFDPRD